MYLVDTNIWLERLLDQEQSAEVEQFLSLISTDQLLMSDFTLHSISVILDRLGQYVALLQFIDDVLVEGKISVRSVHPVNLHRVVDVIKKFGIDFDDAYQYVVARQANAIIVSFDKDFDKTDHARQTPQSVLEQNKMD